MEEEVELPCQYLERVHYHLSRSHQNGIMLFFLLPKKCDFIFGVFLNAELQVTLGIRLWSYVREEASHGRVSPSISLCSILPSSFVCECYFIDFCFFVICYRKHLSILSPKRIVNHLHPKVFPSEEWGTI